MHWESADIFEAGKDRDDWDRWRLACGLAWALGPGTYSLVVSDSNTWTLDAVGET